MIRDLWPRGVKPRGRLPAVLVAIAAAIAIPALAQGAPERAPGTIRVVDFGFEDPATGESTVTINAGETVTFSYPDGNNFHNIEFDSLQPTSCTIAGGSPGPPPMPPGPSGDPWLGSCLFNAAGTYDFVCGAHGFMTGTVVVQGGATPTPTTTATATATVTATATASATATSTASATPTATATTAESTPAAPPTTAPPTGGETLQTPIAAASRPVVARSQRGHAVKGSISVARAGSRVKVELLAKPRALGRKGSKPIKVGSATKSAGAGTATFTVNLNSAARKVLRSKRKLALTVKITVTPASGAPFSSTATVTLKR